MIRFTKCGEVKEQDGYPHHCTKHSVVKHTTCIDCYHEYHYYSGEVEEDVSSCDASIHTDQI